MDNKIMVAIIAVIAIVGGACGVFLLMGNGGDKSVPGLLNIEAPGTYENGTYDTVIICASVGDGDVLLKNIKIVKELIIRGGGSHSVTVDSCTLEGTVTTDKQGGQDIRIVSNNTTITSVNAKSNTIFESTGTGSFESVAAEGTAKITVQGSETKVDSVSMSTGTSLTVTDGTVGNVSMSTSTTLNVGDGSVSNVTVGKDCSVTMQIDSNGSVDTLTVADNVSVTTSGEQTEAKLNETTIKMDSNADGAAVTINGEEKHVHTYQLVSVDWTTLNTQTMTVTGQIECISCENSQEGHSYEETLQVSAERVEPTCTVAGSVTYSVKWGTTTMVKDPSEVLPALGHDYHVEFTWADDNSSASYVATCAHDRAHVEQGSVDSQTVSSTPATCTADGSTVYSVSVTLSDGVHSDQKTVVQPKGHHYEIVDVDLMSVESGNDQSLAILATLVCTVCDDQTDGHEIQVRLPVVSGSESSPDCGNGTPGYLDMTLLYNGEELSFHRDMPAEHTYHISSVNTQDRDHPTVTLICRECQNTVENIAATPVITDRVEPDCVTPGSYMYHVECTYNGILYQSLPEPVIIPLLGHDYQFNWEWGPNNLTATLIVTCARDGCDFHADCRAEVDVNTTATCTVAGNTVFTATANFLNKEKTDTKSVSGAPLGHDYHVTDVDWDTFDKNAMTVTATKVCSRCHDGDPGHSVTESVAVYVAITDPTCTLEGNRHYYVESPQENGFNESIPALGHDCEYTFEWSQDFASAIMHEVCTRDGCDYHKDYQASVNPVTTPSTCSVAGQTVYTATCTPDHGPQQTDTKTVSLPLAEHTYVITEIQWNTLNQEARTVEVVKTCSVCDESADGHTATETVAVLVETTPATCTEAGSNHFYVDGTELEGYDVAIPATGHHLTHHAGQAAKCTEVGWQEFDTCDVCGHTTFTEIPALGHDLVHHDAKAPAMGEVGWDAYDTCNRCDYTTYVEIPALHGYTITVYGGVVGVKGNPETFTQITVPENTVVTVTYNGSDFGYWSDSYDDYIPGESFDILVACDLYVTAHDVNDREYGAWAVESEPTCTEDGLMCRTSGEFREYRVIPALGHISDGVLVVDIPATCTTAGAGHTTCERCHGEIDEVIEATGHHHVFTTEVLADGPIVGKLKGVCSECGHTVLKDYIVPVYPTGDMVVTFDWDNARHDVNATLRDEVHTMWKFTDAQGVERQAYLYQIVRDIHHNGYISGVDVTTWVFWADYGAHSPVYIARHNDTTPVYGGQSNNASWAVAGYVDNMAEFAYFLDNLSAEVMVGGEEFHLTLGMDNGAHASALFDLYDKWADRFNEGMAGLYSIDHATYLGWDCTVYYNDDESFYVNSDNCCVRWATNNRINGIERGDIVRVVSVDTEFTKPFTQGYWNSSNFPSFSSYYFNSMPTLDNSTYFCVKLINGNYNSADFTQGSYRLNFFNGDSRNLIMWITPNLGSHEQLDRIEVLSLDGVWMTVPSVLSDGHYVFDIQDKSIVGLYRYMMENNPGRFVLPNDPAFNGVYIRCVTSKVPYDSTVTVIDGTFKNEAYEYVSEGPVYGGEDVYLRYEDKEGKEFTGINVKVGDGEPQFYEHCTSYEVPEGSSVTIQIVYKDREGQKVQIDFTCTAGGSIDGRSGLYYVGDYAECNAFPGYGYIFVGWFDVTGGLEPAEDNQCGWYSHFGASVRAAAAYKAVFKPIDAALLAEDYTIVLATGGFIHWADTPVYLSALYGSTEYSENRINTHADPNLEPVHRWDMFSNLELVEGELVNGDKIGPQFPIEPDEEFDVKYSGDYTTVKAVFESEVEYYEVTLYDRGEVFQRLDIANDVPYYAPYAPEEREGYNFIGWNTAEDGSDVAYEAGDTVELDGDLVLYAQWEAKTFRTRVNVDGLSYRFYNTTSAYVIVTYGQTATIPANLATLYGATLTGWYYMQDEQKVAVASDGTGMIPYGISDIYAVFEYKQYTFTFDKGAEDATGTMQNVTFTIADLEDEISYFSYVFDRNSITFQRPAYYLSKWTFNDTGMGTSYSSVKITSSILQLADANENTINLTAVWLSKDYYVKYSKGDIGNGTFLGTLSSSSFRVKADAPLTLNNGNAFSCSGLTFIGWNTAIDGSGRQYAPGESVGLEFILANYSEGVTNITLYALWAKPNYGITFHGPEGAEYSTASDYYVYNTPNTLPLLSAMGAGFSVDGYTFLYWTEDPQGLFGEHYTDGATVSALTRTGSLDLYGVWAPNTYTVVFDANGGEGSMENQTFQVNVLQALTANAYSREGFHFEHWCNVDYNQGAYFEDGEEVRNLCEYGELTDHKLSSTVTLYASWYENE